MEINTTRLRLIPLDLENLELLRKGRSLMEQNLGLQPSEMQISVEMQKEIADASKYWTRFARYNPEQFFWGTNWEVVLKEENRSIGNIGLSGLPDKEGKVTVGYTIDERYQQRGMATEALQGLKQWVFSHPEAKKIWALTPIENIPSQRVLEKNGFENVAEVEEEGLQCYLWESGRG